MHDQPHSPASLNATRTPLALYVHWPFCVSKCPYCDFNSHVRAEIEVAAWQDALLADLEHESRAIEPRPLSSIFFGGGTPSLMPPSLVARLIKAAEAAFGFAPGIEITLEANPSSVEAARFGGLAQAGVNRVSLGLQSLEDDALRFLGRAHTVTEGLQAMATAQMHFGRVSFDLIYALPDQDEVAWRSELDRALALGTGHVSLYQLTIEPGTRFETLARTGTLKPLDDDRAADLFTLTQEVTGAAGLKAYEISNHARRGEESAHNLTYWRYRDYLGIGPGAHGRRGGMATIRHRKPENYLAAVARNGHGLQSEELLEASERASEALLMGLRLAEGVDLMHIAQNSQTRAAHLIDMQAAERLSSLGLVERSGSRLRVTPAGMPLLDAILPRIVAIEPEPTPC